MLKKLLIAAPDNSFIEFFRYTIVGGLSFLVDFGFLYVFTEFLGIYYLVSAAMSFSLGLAVNYGLSRTWVFGKRNLANAWIEFGLFAAIGVVGLGLNELFIWYFTSKIHFYYLLSKIVSTVLVYLWNFFARKYLLFK